MSAYRCLMIGAGGMAGVWIRRFWPNFFDRVEIQGLVDINEEALCESGEFLGLDEGQMFTEQEEAFTSTDADLCCIVTPPAVHEQSVLLACEKGMDILSEKPIADTWDGCCRIYDAVRRAGVRMAVTQNYRYDARIRTFKQVIESGRVGRLNYLHGRFAADYRKYGAWGAWRHELQHALLVEGGVHHLDQLRNLAGADCETICGHEWNPEWSSFKHGSNALFVMRFENGVTAVYEGNNNAAGHQNNWHSEYYRAECEDGAVVLDNDDQVWIHQFSAGEGMELTQVPHVQARWEGHDAVISAFLDWLDGGDEPGTAIDDNIKTAATLFAAIESASDRKLVEVRAKLADIDA